MARRGLRAQMRTADAAGIAGAVWLLEDERDVFLWKQDQIAGFERFGSDFEVDSAKQKQKQKEALLELGFDKAWCTDRLGIFSLVDDTHL